MRDENEIRKIHNGINWIEIQGENALNLLNDRFWWNVRPDLGPLIYGTKCDRDKPSFSAKRGRSIR